MHPAAERNADPGSTKTAIVTGGAGALGAAVARMLVGHGYEVAIVDIQAERGRLLTAQLKSNGGRVRFHEMDIRDQAAWLTLRSQLQSTWSQLDALVNAAGTTWIGEFCRTDIEIQAKVLDVNLLGAMRGCHVMCPWLANHPRQSHLINVSSCTAFLSLPWSAMYNASKAGLMSFSETLTAEFTNSPMHICTVCPGFFDSDLFAFSDQDESALERVVRRLVERSSLTPELVAQRIWEAMRRRQSYVLVPRRVQWMWWLQRISPEFSVRRIARTGQRLRKRYSKKPQ